MPVRRAGVRFQSYRFFARRGDIRHVAHENARVVWYNAGNDITSLVLDGFAMHNVNQLHPPLERIRRMSAFSIRRVSTSRTWRGGASVVAMMVLFLFAIGIVAADESAVSAPAHQDHETDRPPNVVFILVDDLGWTDLGCFGSGFYETPHVDQLAKSAMRFTQAYAACQVCSPTRASILTGRYPQRYGVTDYINPAGGNQPEKWRRPTAMLPAPYRDHLPLEEVTLAEHLKRAGYATFFAGKWHLGNEGQWPEDQGFDVNMGGIDRGGPYGGNRYFSPYGNPRLPDGPPGEHLPDRLATETVKFIRQHRDEPFLAYLSFYSVHTPLMARKDLEQHYLDLKARIRFRGPIWGQEGKRKVRLVQEHAVYAAMVTAMDQAVGKVLASLDELGLTENTIVIFTSDNGGLSTSEGHPTSNVPLRAGKGWIYEGGIRVPAIVRVPGTTPAASECHQYVSSVDYLPTILELCGVEPDPGTPGPIDGVSFAPLLHQVPMDRGPIYWHYPHYGNQGGSPSSAVRDGRWKLIQWLESDQYSLFDIESDIGEQHDLATEQVEVVDRLKRELATWQKSVGAKFPTKRE